MATAAKGSDCIASSDRDGLARQPSWTPVTHVREGSAGIRNDEKGAYGGGCAKPRTTRRLEGDGGGPGVGRRGKPKTLPRQGIDD